MQIFTRFSYQPLFFLQSIPTSSLATRAAVATTTTISQSETVPPPQDPSQLGTGSDSATKLAEAIDDFLGDLENKFKGISNEILSKLDDMAERCDRLEAELLMKEAVMAESSTSTTTTINTANTGKPMTKARDEDGMSQ